MFQKIPGLQKAVLIGVTVFLAAIFGIPAAVFFVKDSGSKPVALLGDTKITSTMVRQYSKTLQAVYMRELEIAKPGQAIVYARRTTPEGRTYNHLALHKLAHDSGIRISRDELRAHVTEIIDKAGGLATIRETLGQQGVDEAKFIEGIRERMAIDKLLSYVCEHLLKPNYQAAFEALQRGRQRHAFRAVRIELPGVHTVTAAQEKSALEAFYTDYKESRFTTPARALFELVSEPEPDDATLRKVLAEHRAQVMAAVAGDGHGADQHGDAQLLTTHRAAVMGVYLRTRKTAPGADAWAALETALKADPMANLRALADTLGLRYRRPESYLDQPATEAFDPRAAGLPKRVMETLAPGETSPLPTKPVALQYRVRLLDRTARVVKPFAALSTDELLEAASKEFEAQLQTDATYRIEVVGVELDDPRPLGLTTRELTAFYEQHKARLWTGKDGKARPFARVRADVERLLSRIRRHEVLSQRLETVQKAAAKASAVDPASQRPGVEPPRRSETEIKAYDLAKQAAERGLYHAELTLTAKQLADHPLLAGELSENDLRDQSPGWVGNLEEGRDRFLFVRLLEIVQPTTPPFAQIREKTRELVLVRGLTKTFKAEAKAIREALQKDFAAAAAQPGRQLFSFTGISNADELTRLPQTERTTVFNAASRLGKDGELSQVVFADKDTVAYVVQRTAVALPAEAEIKAFEIEKQTMQAMRSTWSSAISESWFQPNWYILSGQQGLQLLVAPREDPKGPGKQLPTSDGGAKK